MRRCAFHRHDIAREAILQLHELGDHSQRSLQIGYLRIMLMSELLDHSLELDVSSLESILSYIGTLLEVISDIAHGFPPSGGCNAHVGIGVRDSAPFIQPRDHAATVIANS